MNDGGCEEAGGVGLELAVRRASGAERNAFERRGR
jgi:hypothetical protein